MMERGHFYGKKPDWLRVPIRSGAGLKEVKDLLRDLHLHTVCEAANCPNRMECFSKRTATFMLLGDVCTRSCRFCNVRHGMPRKPEADEPERVAEAVRRLNLKHAVLTSVTRDDLPDGGAAQFAVAIQAIRRNSPSVRIEVLIPDLGGSYEALASILVAVPDILNHNLETVPRLYPAVRPEADYRRSLELLKRSKGYNPQIYTKSGLMVGLGETEGEIEQVMDDLREAGCEFLTIGQYLPPSKQHYPAAEYVHPDQFAAYRRTGYKKGFSFVASAPFVRSSYQAATVLDSLTSFSVPKTALFF